MDFVAQAKARIKDKQSSTAKQSGKLDFVEQAKRGIKINWDKDKEEIQSRPNDFILEDGTYLGKISKKGIDAIANNSLDTYIPIADWEKESIDKYKKYVGSQMADLAFEDGPNFGKLSYDGIMAMQNGEQYIPKNQEEKDTMSAYTEYMRAQPKTPKDPKNWWQGTWQTPLYWGEKILSGALGGVENLADYASALGSGTVGLVSSGFGLAKNKASDFFYDSAEGFLTDKNIADAWNENIEERYSTPQWARYGGDTFKGAGELALPVLLEYFSAGASPALEMQLAKAASTAPKVQKITQMATQGAKNFLKPSSVAFGLNAAGSSAKEGFRQSQDLGKSLMYGAMSGAAELATEQLFGGFAGTDVGESLIDFAIKNPAVRKAVNIAAEGAEEVIMAGIDPFLRRVTFDKNASMPTLKEYGESGLQGILLSVLMGAGMYPIQKHKEKETAKLLNVPLGALKILMPDKNISNIDINKTNFEELKKIQQQILDLTSEYENRVINAVTQYENTTNAETQQAEPVVSNATPQANISPTPSAITPEIFESEFDELMATDTSGIKPGDVLSPKSNSNKITVVETDGTKAKIEVDNGTATTEKIVPVAMIKKDIEAGKIEKEPAPTSQAETPIQPMSQEVSDTNSKMAQAKSVFANALYENEMKNIREKPDGMNDEQYKKALEIWKDAARTRSDENAEKLAANFTDRDFKTLSDRMHKSNKYSLAFLKAVTGMPVNNQTNIKAAIRSLDTATYDAWESANIKTAEDNKLQAQREQSAQKQAKTDKLHAEYNGYLDNAAPLRSAQVKKSLDTLFITKDYGNVATKEFLERLIADGGSIVDRSGLYPKRGGGTINKTVYRANKPDGYGWEINKTAHDYGKHLEGLKNVEGTNLSNGGLKNEISREGGRNTDVGGRGSTGEAGRTGVGGSEGTWQKSYEKFINENEISATTQKITINEGKTIEFDKITNNNLPAFLNEKYNSDITFMKGYAKVYDSSGELIKSDVDGFIYNGKQYVTFGKDSEKTVIHEGIHDISKKDNEAYREYDGKLRAQMNPIRYKRLYDEFYERYADVYSHLTGQELQFAIEEEITAFITANLQTGNVDGSLFVSNGSDTKVVRLADKFVNKNMIAGEGGRKAIGDSTKFAIEPSFYDKFDAWNKNDRRGYFTLGYPSDALISVGIPPNSLIINKDTMLGKSGEHGYDIELFRQLPDLLENPMLILESLSLPNDAYVIYGDMRDEQGRPMMVSLFVGKNNKITSMYARQKTGTPKSDQQLISRSKILYPQTYNKRTAEWAGARGLQLPLRLSQSGSLDTRLSQNKPVVNTNISESKKNDTKFSVDNKAQTGKGELAHIKEQLQTAAPMLNKIDVVGVLNVDTKGKTAKQIENMAKNLIALTPRKIDVLGLGIVEFDKKQIATGLNYSHTKAEKLALALVPNVLKRGKNISGHINHKIRGFSTITFGAPVKLNGKRGNMAVVVTQDGKNRYKAHRILLPDGSTFVLDATNETAPTDSGVVHTDKSGTTVTDSGLFHNDLSLSQNKPVVNTNISESKKNDTLDGNNPDIRYSIDNNSSSIKEQLRTVQDMLNEKNVVKSVNVPNEERVKTKDVRAKVMKLFKNIGFKVDRPGFGVIEVDEKSINRSLNYLNNNAEYAAFAAVPAVLKRGIEISGHNNHKGRGFATLTFAAPVELNGQRGNLAVVVKQEGKSRYKTHRILTPDGKAFILDEINNAEATTDGGFNEVTPSITSASNDNVPQKSDTVNSSISNSPENDTDNIYFSIATEKTVDEMTSGEISLNGIEKINELDIFGENRVDPKKRKTKGNFKEMLKHGTRTLKYIPEGKKDGGQRFAEVRRAFLQFKNSVGLAKNEVLSDMKKYLNTIKTAEQRKNFEALILYNDLKETYEIEQERNGSVEYQLDRNGNPITEVDIEANLKRLNDSADETTKNAVQSYYAMSKRLADEYTKKHIPLGYDRTGWFGRKYYYPHDVIAHMDDIKGSGLYSPTINAGRGFNKRREGSSLPYNTNVLPTIYKHFLQMQSDIYKADFLLAVQEYDIKTELENTAFKQNRQSIEDIITEEAGGKFDKNGKPNSETYRERQKLNRNIMLGYIKLFELAKNGELTGDTAVINALANGNLSEVNSTRLHRYLSELVQGDNEAAGIAAKTIFKYENQKAQWIKSKLGKDFVTWQDLALQTEGYSITQPRKGNHFYNAEVIAAEEMDKHIPDWIAGILAGEHETTQIPGFAREFAKTLRLQGASYKQIVIPDQIINQMNEVTRSMEKTANAKASKIATVPMNTWKGIQTVLSPFRTVRFFIRNLFGDLDAFVAGMPMAKKSTYNFIKQAAIELKDAMVNDKFSEGMQEWKERGGYGQLILTNELDAETQKQIFKKLAAIDPANKQIVLSVVKQLGGGYVDAVQFVHAYREGLLRYASFLIYKDILTTGKTVYGASNKHIIDGLKNNADKAYQLSNDLLGAYDQISTSGQVIRKFIIPFYSFTEANFKRYWRLLENTFHEAKIGSKQDAAKQFGKVGGTILRRFGWNVLKLWLKMNLLGFLMYAWNNFIMDEQEKGNPEYIRSRPHINLGKIGSQSLTFDRLGSWAEVLEWFGSDAILENIKEGNNLGEIAAKVPENILNKAVNMLNPFMKMIPEIATSESWYPGLTDRSVIRDPLEYFLKSWQLDSVYRWANKRPQEYNSLELVLYSQDVHETAFNEIYRMKSDFKGTDDSMSFKPKPKQNALYYMKKAMKLGQKDIASKQLNDYFKLGGDAKGLLKSFGYLSPFYGLGAAKGEEPLTSDERQQLASQIGINSDDADSRLLYDFWNGLDNQDKTRFKMGVKYWEENLEIPDDIKKRLNEKDITNDDAKTILMEYMQTK